MASIRFALVLVVQWIDGNASLLNGNFVEGFDKNAPLLDKGPIDEQVAKSAISADTMSSNAAPTKPTKVMLWIIEAFERNIVDDVCYRYPRFFFNTI
mmetsp:Transcript_2853/g.7837  ORF Transcript_2853/g.7837 Transcript_2853/m.7837 type:complete len:97 (-) Transcript_2853:55-345(-)